MFMCLIVCYLETSTMRQPRPDLDCCFIKKIDVNTGMLFADYSADTLKANPVTLLVEYIIYRV